MISKIEEGRYEVEIGGTVYQIADYLTSGWTMYRKIEEDGKVRWAVEGEFASKSHAISYLVDGSY